MNVKRVAMSEVNWICPNSEGNIFFDYIPEQILNDYNEACEIKDLSPKTSATLAIKCLQEMIRDFWKVNKGVLINEIEEIKDRIDPLTWSAINSVRKTGNIDTYMKKDVNKIIDVEQREAELLVNLIGTLLDVWYITKYKREENLFAIIALSKDKSELINI
ncbi:MAG: hypothetical protein ACJAWW_002829 [Sulfurimonas sp.]|jgi:hypothetical protein